MLFNQIEFALFFFLTILFLLLVRQHRIQKLFLLAASYYFYAYWDWRFVGLLLFSTLMNFTAGLVCERITVQRWRKSTLLLSLLLNLGVLGLFKYYNFFMTSFAGLISAFGIEPGTMEIILPIGISFYTFEGISYVVDVYRRKIRAHRDIFDFALFIAFFPHLVAGPIIRPAQFIPQLEWPRRLSWERTFLGFRQFAFGLFKKVIVADTLARFVDLTFSNPGTFDWATTWLSVIAYSLQIYCDFSGYTDMAIGVAKVLGYDLPLNFNAPYLATSPSDFWRRWHISLSTWLRDYLYIPLGGNRKGEIRTYVNLMVTMLLAGLWHGAAWSFVFWGGWHGMALSVDRISSKQAHLKSQPSSLNKAAGWLLTMLMVMVGWVFFRAQNLSDALLIIHQMFLPQAGINWLPPWAILLILMMVAIHILQALRIERWLKFQVHDWYTPVFLFLLLWIVVIFHPKGFTPFIYFQF